ncbi:MAG TPA: hypothetical protein VLA04_00760 [Verrucomicrobiae bacterium]|nr:hypothetical protein [Verrucomicrobiae bacterium]
MDTLEKQTEPAANSQAFTLYPIMRALDVASDLFPGKTLDWKAANPMQEIFLRFFSKHRDELNNVTGLDAIADFDFDKVNAWIRDKGFTIQLDPAMGPGNPFATASVYDQLVNWRNPGKVTTVHTEDNTSYPAFHLKNGVEVRTYRHYSHPIVQIATESGHSVFITVLDAPPDAGLAVFDAAIRLNAGMADIQSSYEYYKGAIIPMVNLNQENDISWMKGLFTDIEGDMPAIISQALMQTKLRMNENGARMQAAVALGVSRGISMDEPYVVNRSFLYWCTQPGVTLPVFAAYVTPEDWSNPGDMSKA